jgi:hypothetical protein
MRVALHPVVGPEFSRRNTHRLQRDEGFYSTNMMSDAKHCVIDCIHKFCGQKPQRHDYILTIDGYPSFPPTGMGHSQLNELLLSLHLDRTTADFFEYVFRGPVVHDLDSFTKSIREFRTTAILHYGNIKFAFKRLSQMSKKEIESEIGRSDPGEIRDHYTQRHDPLVAIRRIAPRDTYYLGYIIDAELEAKRKELEGAGGPTETLDERERQCSELRKIGEFNHHCYLDYDHMDVYVATSMREKSDFWNVSRFVSEVFSRPEIEELKLRYFDPTQAYCRHRIDKGLSEALMLKRAQCAIYMAGESDTLGKDSELAATLAQGKPVIVYVPRLSDYDRFRQDIAEGLLAEVYVDEDRTDVALKFLQTYAPEAAWERQEVRRWIEKKPTFDTVLQFVYERAQALYDRRARTLLETHPLGLQVNLQTGVGNGVLVARDTNQCAKLLRGILLNELEFDLEEQPGLGAIFLREKETRSVYRVVTHDQHLTNSFWNFYLKQ